MNNFHGILCVKSIMTIILTCTLTYLTIVYPETYADTFKSCVTMVVTFYFAHQTTKAEKQQKESDSNERD